MGRQQQQNAHAAIRLDRDRRERAQKTAARDAAGWQARRPLSEHRLQLVEVDSTRRRHKWVRARAA